MFEGIDMVEYYKTQVDDCNKELEQWIRDNKSKEGPNKDMETFQSLYKRYRHVKAAYDLNVDWSEHLKNK